jgi:DNA-directed RNA polymerase specialized sigma24 family protein
VMDRWRSRSGGVEDVMAAPAQAAPAEADLAFESLYRSSRDDIFRYVAGLLRDRSAAEEVTAVAFERAYRKRGSFDARRGTPRAWLFGIARNVVATEFRRADRERRAHARIDAPRQAAAALGIRPVTARVRLHRARTALQAELYGDMTRPMEA